MNRIGKIAAAFILILIAVSVLTTLISGSCLFWLFVILAIGTMVEVNRIMNR